MKPDIKDALAIACLLSWSAFIKPSIALPDIFIVGLFNVMVLKSESLAWIICGLFGAFAVLTIDSTDIQMASHARGHRLLTDGVQFLSGGLCFGIAGILADLVNKIRDNFWLWTLPAALTCWLITNQKWTIWLFFGALVCNDLLRTSVNSVAMTWGFTVLLAVCLCETNKPNEKLKTN